MSRMVRAAASGSAVAAEAQQPGQVGDVLLAGLGVLVVAVVGLVGQPEPALRRGGRGSGRSPCRRCRRRSRTARARRSARTRRGTPPGRARRAGWRPRRAAAAPAPGPSAAIASVSMKEAKRSPILRASSSGADWSGAVASAARSVMMSRTWASAASASCTNGPQLERSDGISVSASQRPLTWPNRSSWGRVSGSMPARASSRMLTAATLAADSPPAGVASRRANRSGPAPLAGSGACRW